MIFDNRKISEITPQELIDLIGSQEENLWIDFKQQDYHKDPNDCEKYKREICKDVTAMANAEGGYIIIGISEKNKLAQGFFTVPDAANLVKRINGICLQYIDPRIPNFEVEPYSLKWENKDIELVIVHIPPSEIRPHRFIWGGSSNFVKRYGDNTREYPMSELGEAFSVRHYPPIIGSIDRKLDTISRNMEVDRRNSMTPEDDPLEQVEVRDLLHLMKLRFDETISDQPYYRIFALPKELIPDAVDTYDEGIREIMHNPPNRRFGRFGIRGLLRTEMAPSTEGIAGPNENGGEIILLKNGYLEVRCPIDIQFQGAHRYFRIPDCIKWLYPYVVCEFPVTFLRLVKAVYDAAGINSDVFVQQEYRNLTGFMLPGGAPSEPFFGVYEDERGIYTHSTPIVSHQTVPSNFVPDHLAYDLVQEVYDCFKLDKQWIPCFDEEGNFILS
ncbi:MAG: ATP-binding protein [Candidatus Poribacteria bacterium]|nr:ATP-binding protein [Candidatus Poribacteria bacterium]